jgi:hypothetical protein
MTIKRCTRTRQKQVNVSYVNTVQQDATIQYYLYTSVGTARYSPRFDSRGLVSLGGVRLSPLGTSATVGLLYQPRMIDDDYYGAVGGMRIGRGNRSTRRKPAPVPLCPPQIPHELTWDRTRAATVGSQRLTAWAMARPTPEVYVNERFFVNDVSYDVKRAEPRAV